MFERLAAVATQRPRRVLIGLVVFLAVAFPLGGPVPGLLSAASSNFEDDGSESVQARERAEEATGESPSPSLIVLVDLAQDADEAESQARVEEIAGTVAADPGVSRVLTYYGTGDESFVSTDGTSTYALAFYRDISADEAEAATERIEAALEDEPDVTLGGNAMVLLQVGSQVESDLLRAELLAFPILFLLSLFFFRGVVAALLPLLAGVIAIMGTFLGLRIANEITPISIFAINLVTGLGLGLAIDYSLFIVSRYREELARVGAGAEAIRRTLQTAGRTILFSSLTVTVALLALLIFPQPFLYSMGIGGILVSVLSAATALLVLPSVLALLGTRVNAGAPARWRRSVERTSRMERSGFWYRLSQGVMRRAIPVAVASAALLIALGLPFLGVEFTDVDARILPADKSARQVHDALQADFPPSAASPVLSVVEAPADAGAEVADYAEAVAGLPNVAQVGEPRPAGDGLWLVEAVPVEEPLQDATLDLVDDTRAVDTTLDVAVGGQTAEFVDQQGSLSSRLPWGLAILAVGTFALLFLMTGSVVLPVKALIMNLLTVSATFGILVLIFQDGRLEGLLDYESLGALDATQPILIFVLAFGLSTDYAVFLLGRIKEARDAGMTNTEAVAAGLERTGRIVTAAAVLFAIAIGAFSTSEIVFIKQIGVGTALAVLIDATIVRALLVPSLMKLLGDRNWWSPGPLRRLHERLVPSGRLE